MTSEKTSTTTTTTTADSATTKKSEKVKKKTSIALWFWRKFVDPILTTIAEETGESIDKLVWRLVETNTTLGYVCKIYDVKSFLRKKLGPWARFIRYVAESAKPEEVERFVDFLVEKVFKKCRPDLYQMFKRDDRAYLWLKQSIFELWQLAKEL